jgi:hypothetical protein
MPEMNISHAYSIYYNLFIGGTEIKSYKLFCAGNKYDQFFIG